MVGRSALLLFGLDMVSTLGFIGIKVGDNSCKCHRGGLSQINFKKFRRKFRAPSFVILDRQGKVVGRRKWSELR
jgi:hypothetical protein